MERVFVAVEGYSLPNGFVVKELTVIKNNSDVDHFIFMKPDVVFTAAETKTIAWTTKYLNGLKLTDGHIPYNTVPHIISQLSHSKIFCYGSLTTKFLRSIIPLGYIIDVQLKGFSLPKNLKDSHLRCGRSHPIRFCAMAKANAIKNFIIATENRL